MILVDHNEKSQAVDGLEEAEIMEIIDHHRLGSIETMGPVYFRNQPVGYTATIIYQMYQENQVEITPQIAGLLCSAIISDTLLFRSPTCTQIDQLAALALAKQAGIQIDQYAADMFAAGSNLRGKSDEEIFYQDFKQFEAGKLTFGVGQISSVNVEELEELKERMLPYLKEAIKAHGMDMLFFMLTNILTESTELLCEGTGAKQLIVKAFHLDTENDNDTENEQIVSLPGVVSRKKQLVPGIMIVEE